MCELYCLQPDRHISHLQKNVKLFNITDNKAETSTKITIISIVIAFRVVYSGMYTEPKMMYHDSPKGWSGTSIFDKVYIPDTR